MTDTPIMDNATQSPQASGPADDRRLLQFPRLVTMPFEPVPAVVHICEEMLKYARTGQLTAIGVAVVYCDDQGLERDYEINSGWAEGRATYYALSCAIQKLERARSRYIDKIPEPEQQNLIPPPPVA